MLPENNPSLWWCSKTHSLSADHGQLRIALFSHHLTLLRNHPGWKRSPRPPSPTINLTDHLSEPLLFPPLCNFAVTDGFGAEQPTSSPHTNKQVIQNNEKIRGYFSFVCNQKPGVSPSARWCSQKPAQGPSWCLRPSGSWCNWCWDGPSTLTAYTERLSQLISFHAMGMLPQATDSLHRQTLVWDATIPCRVHEMRMKSTFIMPSGSHYLWQPLKMCTDKTGGAMWTHQLDSKGIW